MLNARGPSAFQRAVRRGLLAAWRGGRYSATMLLLVGVMTLLQVLAAAVIGAQAVHGMLLSRSALYLEVMPDATDQDIQELYAAMRALPYVRGVEFVPSEKAYETERERTPDLVAFLERYQLDNPFPDSFSVSLDTLADYDAFAAFIGGPQWSDVVDPAFLSDVTNQEQDVRQMLGVASAVRALLALLTLVGVVVLFFLLAEIVARKARKHEGELLLESLLGGKPADALVPLVSELAAMAVAALVAGTIIAAVLLAAASLVVPIVSGLGGIPELAGRLTGLLFTAGIPVFVAEVLLIVAVSAAAAVAGIRPHRLWPSPAA